jgi:hypothetical protein
MIKRRSLIQALALSPVAFVLPRVSFAAGATAGAAGTPANALSEAEPLSKAMKYVVDASKAGPERADKKANCLNCQKWNKCSAADAACKPGAKDAAYAPCEIFAGKVVAKNAWCMSWTKA